MDCDKPIADFLESLSLCAVVCCVWGWCVGGVRGWRYEGIIGACRAGAAPVLTAGLPDYNSSTDWLDENPRVHAQQALVTKAHA